MITLSTSKPVSPFGRDLKGTFAALQSLLRTKAINFTLRLATIPFRSRRNIIDLIRGALDTDEGLIEVLLERLEKQRLPRLLALNEKVDSGESLGGLDLDFLEMSIADARKAIPLIDRHPEYQKLATQVMALYKDISEKALQIEKSS